MTIEAAIEDLEMEKAIVRALLQHRDMTAPEVHTFVAIYTTLGAKHSRRKLATLLNYDRKIIALAISRLETRGLVRCAGQAIRPVPIFKGL